MSGYRIDPKGVEATLQATSGVAEELDADVKNMGSDILSASQACGGKSVVVTALISFYEAEDARLGRMGSRVNACISGAVAATQAYVNADSHMAQETKAAEKNAVAGKTSTFDPRRHRVTGRWR